MKLLKLEFFKCRRRKILLVCAAVLAVELIWMGAFFTRQDAENLRWGWMLLLYNLSMVDAIILPILSDEITARLTRFLVESRLGVVRLEERQKSLEDIFLALTGKAASL